MMRNKEKRLVVLKDLQLCKAMPELRNSFYQAFEDHSLRFFQKMDLICFDGTLDNEGRKERVDIFYQKNEKSEPSHQYSVLSYRVCGKRDFNSIINPTLNK
ncbi:MAG: hypothetical protein ACFFHD_05390 [Promethearchaeota archaeon]